MPFEEAMLGGMQNVICMQMVNYLTSNKFFHYLTDDTREGDWSVILYVASDALFINRDNECTFPRKRERDRERERESFIFHNTL